MHLDVCREWGLPRFLAYSARNPRHCQRTLNKPPEGIPMNPDELLRLIDVLQIQKDVSKEAIFLALEDALDCSDADPSEVSSLLGLSAGAAAWSFNFRVSPNFDAFWRIATVDKVTGAVSMATNEPSTCCIK